MHYRVSASGYATLVTQLYFDSERSVPGGLATRLVREGGVLAAGFELTLARAGGQAFSIGPLRHDGGR
jgi:hypothetical protein